MILILGYICYDAKKIKSSVFFPLIVVSSISFASDHSLWIVNNTNQDLYLNNLKIPAHSTASKLMLNATTVSDLGVIHTATSSNGPSVYFDPAASSSVGTDISPISETVDTRDNMLASILGNNDTSASSNPQAFGSTNIQIVTYNPPNFSFSGTELTLNVNGGSYNQPTLALSWPTPSSVYSSVESKSATVSASGLGDSTQLLEKGPDSMSTTPGSVQGEVTYPLDISSGESQVFQFKWWLHLNLDQFLPLKYSSSSVPPNAISGDYLLEINSAPTNTSDVKDFYMFGDSLSDNHMLYGLSNGSMPRGDYYDGRFANGENWVDLLSMLDGIPMYDYAVADANIMPIGSQSDNYHPSDDLVQEDKYGIPVVAGANDNPNIPDLMEELDAANPSMSKKISEGQQIVIGVLMGGDDFKHIFDENDLSPSDEITTKDAEDAADTLVDDLSAEVAQLESLPSSSGKPQPIIFVEEVPNFQLAPLFRNTPAAELFSEVFNKTVASKLKSSPLNYVLDDSAKSVIDALNANPTMYGINSDGPSNVSDNILWGNLSNGNFNDYNILGFTGYTKSDGGSPCNRQYDCLSLDINIAGELGYNRENAGKTMFAGYMHPSSKVYALSADEVFYNLSRNMTSDGDTIIDSSAFKNDKLQQDILSYGGVLNSEAMSSSDIIDQLNWARESRPDWANGYNYNTNAFMHNL
ncbi:SGNH/GDSL hydrolase family protein [Piscirickettsia litoralis]|uniref:Autotransporter domain-containing protein n=1 Tax=Piscirickettsia litoralis TaxID=1891921 RepID=A0ABX2ZXJ6_9GAMM|nr:SGNH/GDSL hydrolase family protein [Piscirickettsia litoralis]ODN41321.1 hypothetical protein BGC07_17320 [Piscirickettsia litoralis]